MEVIPAAVVHGSPDYPFGVSSEPPTDWTLRQELLAWAPEPSEQSSLVSALRALRAQRHSQVGPGLHGLNGGTHHGLSLAITGW